MRVNLGWAPTSGVAKQTSTSKRQAKSSKRRSTSCACKAPARIDVVIVPYRRGRRPLDLMITRTSDGVLSLLRGGKSTTLAD